MLRGAAGFFSTEKKKISGPLKLSAQEKQSVALAPKFNPLIYRQHIFLPGFFAVSFNFPLSKFELCL